MNHGAIEFAPELLQKYPHMFPADIPVWEAWLRIHGHEFLSFAYDVKVGKGMDPDITLSPRIQRLQVLFTQKRIDVVGTKRGVKWIIEVKDIATVSAPGQVLAYSALYSDTFGFQSVLEPLLIFRLASPDVVRAAELLHVKTESVSVP